MSDEKRLEHPETQVLHAYVSGRVQGVNFRYYTRQTALALGLVGWVRNLVDGRVETRAVGHREDLAKFEAYLRVGPPAGKVTTISVVIEDTTETYESFEILHDSSAP